MARKYAFLEVDDEDLTALVADIRRFGRRVPEGAKEVANDYGRLLLEEVRRNASGRPGPRIITGAYLRSIRMIVDESGGLRPGYRVGVVSSAPQARRLEFGFVGRDRLGRHYHQPPFPHFGPALERLGPQMVAAMSDAVPRWWEGR